MPRKAASNESSDHGPAVQRSTVPFEELEGVPLIEEAILVTEQMPGRQKDDEGLPGGLVLFPKGKRPIIIGDLHSNSDNLKTILDHDTNRADIESGRAACILLGDALHDDRTGYMKDMRSSLVILEDVLRLIVRYPGNVYYIRGNHDTFDERLRKSGISQGVEMKNTLMSERGAEYTAAIDRFFLSMPIFVIGDGFVITHAGPPHGGISREELVNIRKYPEKLHQLMWTRVNEFHGNPSLKEYGEKDIRLTLELLDVSADTQFIVGHNPIWSDGNKTGVWLNVIGIKGHHILYSGYGSAAPYITFVDGAMEVRMTIAKKPEVLYYG